MSFQVVPQPTTTFRELQNKTSIKNRNKKFPHLALFPSTSIRLHSRFECPLTFRSTSSFFFFLKLAPLSMRMWPKRREKLYSLFASSRLFQSVSVLKGRDVSVFFILCSARFFACLLTLNIFYVLFLLPSSSSSRFSSVYFFVARFFQPQGFAQRAFFRRAKKSPLF